MQLQESEIILRPGICVWARPGRKYEAQQEIDDRLGVSFLHFDVLDEAGQPMREHEDLPREVHDLYDVHYVDTVMARVVDLADDDVDPAISRRVASRLLAALLMDIETASSRSAATLHGGTELMHHRMVTDLVATMRENPQGIPSVAEMAKRCGYTPDHFSRVFKEVTGQTPQSFAVATRLNRVCQLLVESDLAIGQIADVLGYDHVYHLTRQFKAKIGVTPSQYRRQGRD